MTRVLFFCFGLSLLAACGQRGRTLYISMLNGSHITQEKNMEVRFQGALIGEVVDRKQIGDRVLFKVAMRKDISHLEFRNAQYRKDIFGDAMFELVNKDSPVKRTEPGRQVDTLIGLYEPVFHELDPAKTGEVVRELNRFMKRMDSILKVSSGDSLVKISL